MGQGRDQRRKREAGCRRGAQSIDPLTDIRRRVKALFANLGVLAAFERMPADYRDQFYRKLPPDPVLVYDRSFPAAEAFSSAYADIRKRVEEGFARAGVDLVRFRMSVRDYFALASPLQQRVASTLRQQELPSPVGERLPPAVRDFLRAAAPKLDAIVNPAMLHQMYGSLHGEVIVPLVGRSRLDGKLLHAELTGHDTPCGTQVVLTLRAEQPATKQITLHNGSRPAFRVGTANVWRGIQWATWRAETVGAEWAGRLRLTEAAGRPVFAQSHALRQLRARLDVLHAAQWIEHWLYESLNRPKISRQLPGGDLLVAYEVMGRRLGYLVVTLYRDMVTVRTFLFLTMAQTPEGRRLRDRLKLTQDEVSYLRLHELSRFTQTDLKDDAVLREQMTACGCGHLFELAEEEDTLRPGGVQPTPFAAELRRYVGLAA